MNYSVVIPAYNATKTIGVAIESVLGQSCPPSQVVVVDDGSTDDTPREVGRFGDRVEVATQTNQGPGAAMSRGMRAARCPWIASIDADDVWLPRKMERQLEFLRRNRACDGVFACMSLFGESVRNHVVQQGWNRSTMTICRRVFESIGEVVDPPGMRGEMIDWIQRAREAGFSLTILDDVLARRRVSPNSLSSRRDAVKDRGYVHVARAALLRKRARSQEAEGVV